MNNGATPHPDRDAIYPLLHVAPDIARGAELIAYPPRFGVEPSRPGRLAIFLRGSSTGYTYNGYVTRVSQLGDLALVEVLDDRTPSEFGDDPALYSATELAPQSNAFLVRAADVTPQLLVRAVEGGL